MERKRVTFSNSYLFNKTKIYLHIYPTLLKRKKKQFKCMNSSNVTMFGARWEIYLYPHTKIPLTPQTKISLTLELSPKYLRDKFWQQA